MGRGQTKVGKKHITFHGEKIVCGTFESYYDIQHNHIDMHETYVYYRMRSVGHKKVPFIVNLQGSSRKFRYI